MQKASIITFLFLFITIFTNCSENSTSSNQDNNQINYVLGEFQNDIINLPQGVAVTIDGRMSEPVWEDAHILQLAENEEIHLMYFNGYLYIGFRTKVRPVTTVYVYRDNKVYVLHSSAAVGSAIYEYNGNGWTRTKEFEWYCRDGSPSVSAENARQAFLADEGWLANISFVGNANETEYKIAMEEETLLIAAAALGEPDYDELSVCPANTNDGCQNIEMITGPIPESATFRPEGWIPVMR